MMEEVLLTVSALQSVGEESDTVESTARAKYYKKGESHYIFYEEMQEGIPGSVKTRVKLNGEVIELKRSGAVATTMIFEKNKTHAAEYDTPYGRLQLAVETESLDISETDEEITAQIQYVLTAEGSPMADCRLSLKITQK